MCFTLLVLLLIIIESNTPFIVLVTIFIQVSVGSTLAYHFTS